jgi:excisionase family DNA binding protein
VVKQKERAISRAVAETMVKRKPHAFVIEGQVKAIQAKEWLTLVEAALLLNVSPLTLRRWTLAGKVKSKKVGRKLTALQTIGSQKDLALRPYFYLAIYLC